MATVHKVQLTYDDESKALRATIRTFVDVAGHRVSVADDLVLEDAGPAAAALQQLIDANRAEMEERATLAAIEHAAALAGKKKAGRKQITVGGTLGAIGKSDVQKV